jgi:hypothetical protein
MSNLLYKEFSLCINIQISIFMCLGPLMMCMPNYPHYASFYYSCVGVFLLFVWGMTNNDAAYTACLPVRRSDIVKARFLCIGFLELLEIGICIPFGIIGSFLNPQGNTAGINATAAFYGLQFAVYALFNFFFLVPCYRKFEKPALPFFAGSAAYWAGYAAAEIPVWFKTKFGLFITSTDIQSQIKQLPVLAAGMCIWAAGMVLTFRICVKQFEKVNL